MITRGSVILIGKDGIPADIRKNGDGNYLFIRDPFINELTEKLRLELMKMNMHLEIVNDEKVTEEDLEEQ